MCILWMSGRVVRMLKKVPKIMRKVARTFAGKRKCREFPKERRKGKTSHKKCKNNNLRSIKTCPTFLVNFVCVKYFLFLVTGRKTRCIESGSISRCCGNKKTFPLQPLVIRLDLKIYLACSCFWGRGLGGWMGLGTSLKIRRLNRIQGRAWTGICTLPVPAVEDED